MGEKVRLLTDKKSKLVGLFCLLVAILYSCGLSWANTVSYQYDDLYRLTRVERSDGTVIIYQYDEAGNRSRKVVTSSTGSPIAILSATPLSGTAPLTASFTDQSTGTVTSRSWNFGDGATSTEQNPVHIYTNSGIYTVSLTVSDGSASNTKTMTDYINVNAATSDTTPDQFTFADQTNAALNTERTSNTITVSGINAVAAISITGGTYSIDGGAYTSVSGTVSNGNNVTVRQTSSGSYSTTTSATLIIGGVSDIFSVTTGADTSGPFAYIPNSGSDNVSVINTATNSVIATIAVGDSPWGVAVNPAGTRVYVTNNGSNNISVIDTSTNSVVATVNVGSGPYGIAVNPIGTKVYVVNLVSNNVSVIDTSTNAVVATVTVGHWPMGVAVNPTGTKVYVTNTDSDYVSVIDTSTNTVVATLAVGDYPNGVAVNPAGTRVYVANRFSDKVSVINTSTHTVVANIIVGDWPFGVAVNPAGTRVYVSNYESDNVSVINTSTNTVVATIVVGSYPLGVAVNPPGTRVYVANVYSDNVSVIDTSTNTVVATHAVGDYPSAFGQFIVPVYAGGIALNAPTLLSPADGATGQATNVSVTWTDTNSSPQEAGYKVRIKPDGGSYTEYSVAQNTTSYSPPGLAAGTKYYWSVKAVGNGTTTLDSTYPADRSLFTANPEQPIIIFQDNFDDNSIDQAKWSYAGNTVSETSGQMQVKTTVTDAGGWLDSAWIPVNRENEITIRKKTLLHYGNNRFIGNMTVYHDGNAGVATNFIGLYYGNMDSWDSTYCAVKGFYITKNSAFPHICATNPANYSSPITPIWNQWFDEKIVYNPVSGMLSYYINNEKKTDFNVGPLPENVQRIKISMSSWGWYTGHYHYIDDISVTQAPISSSSLLTVNKIGTGTGTITSNPAGITCGTDCSDNYMAGTQIELTATPDAGSSFTGWSGGGCSGKEKCQVSLNADTAITAEFTIVTPVAIFSGTPMGTTGDEQITITVGGENVEWYKFRLDNGSWSGELPVSKPIILDKIINGPHTIDVMVRASGGLWPTADKAATFRWMMYRPTSFILGDFNNDFKVDISDILLGMQIIANSGNLSALRKDITRVDVNQNGMIDLGDILFMLQIVSGLRIQHDILDTDKDGLIDLLEEMLGMDKLKVDTDGDGLFDREEVLVYKSHPLIQDTDLNGIMDGDEVKNGCNPKGPGKLWINAPGECP